MVDDAKLAEIEARVRRSIEVVHGDNGASKRDALDALGALLARVRDLEEALEEIADVPGRSVTSIIARRTLGRVSSAASGEERNG